MTAVIRRVQIVDCGDILSGAYARPSDDLRNRLDENGQIEPKRIIIDIPVVEFDSPTEGDVLPATDLG